MPEPTHKNAALLPCELCKIDGKCMKRMRMCAGLNATPDPQAEEADLPPRPVPLTLGTAPVGTKAPAIMGGHWYRTERGWKWNGSNGTGGTFPRPGGDWTGKLIAPQAESQQSKDAETTGGMMEAKRVIGRTRRKLAELLQKEFPTRGGMPVIWNPERITAATGWYRTSRHHGNDSYRWDAFAVFEKSGNVAYACGSYDTMTECVKAGHLVMHSDEEICAKDKP